MTSVALERFAAPSFDDAYALFSPDARKLRSHVVMSGPPPGSLSQVSIRSTETRQHPFAPWLRQIDNLTNLRADWDSYGGLPISGDAIDAARLLLADLSFQSLSHTYVPFHVAPDPTGGVQIEWRRANGAGSLEIWIASNGSMEATIDRPFSEPRFVERALAGSSTAVIEIKTFAT